MAAFFWRLLPKNAKAARRDYLKKKALKDFRGLTLLFGQHLQTMKTDELNARAAEVARLLAKPGVNNMEAIERFQDFARTLRDIQMILDD